MTPAILAQHGASCNSGESDPVVDPHQLAHELVGIMMSRAPADSYSQARALLAAATTVLQDRFSTVAALDALANFDQAVRVRAPAGTLPTAPVLPPDQLAPAVLDHLRAMPRDEAHERARAVVAGSGAYLHEAYGASYAEALLDGTLQVAAHYGEAMRGGRASNEPLH